MIFRTISLFTLSAFLLTTYSCNNDDDSAALNCDQISIAQVPSSQGDEYTLTDVTITGDWMDVYVGYGGGCEAHCFEIIWSGSVSTSIYLLLTHDARNDQCEAYINENVSFDLSLIRNRVLSENSNLDEVTVYIEYYYPSVPLIYHF